MLYKCLAFAISACMLAAGGAVSVEIEAHEEDRELYKTNPAGKIYKLSNTFEVDTPAGVAIGFFKNEYGTFVSSAAHDCIFFVDYYTKGVLLAAGMIDTPGIVDGQLNFARFSDPTRMAYDLDFGRLYVADKKTGRVRILTFSDEKVTTMKTASGDIVTFAFGVQSGGVFPGMDVQIAGQNLFVTDTESLYKVTSSSGLAGLANGAVVTKYESLTNYMALHSYPHTATQSSYVYSACPDIARGLLYVAISFSKNVILSIPISATASGAADKIKVLVGNEDKTYYMCHECGDAPSTVNGYFGADPGAVELSFPMHLRYSKLIDTLFVAETYPVFSDPAFLFGSQTIRRIDLRLKTVDTYVGRDFSHGVEGYGVTGTLGGDKEGEANQVELSYPISIDVTQDVDNDGFPQMAIADLDNGVLKSGVTLRVPTGRPTQFSPPTYKPTTTAQFYTAAPTLKAQFVTVKPTTVAQFSTAVPTVKGQFSTNVPTAAAQFVTQAPTLKAQFVTAAPTKPAQFSTAAPTAKANFVTNAPTTVAQFKTGSPSNAAVPAATTQPTTASQFLTAAPTNEAQFHTRAPTTAAQFSSSGPTTAEQAFTQAPTTVAQFETAAPTTDGQFATSSPSTAVPSASPTTAAQFVTEAPTTAEQFNTARPTTTAEFNTAAPTSTAQFSTAKPTTTAQFSTTTPTTIAQHSTARPTTIAQFTTQSPTTVEQFSTDTPTTTAQFMTNPPSVAPSQSPTEVIVTIQQNDAKNTLAMDGPAFLAIVVGGSCCTCCLLAYFILFWFGFIKREKKDKEGEWASAQAGESLDQLPNSHHELLAVIQDSMEAAAEGSVSDDASNMNRESFNGSANGGASMAGSVGDTMRSGRSGRSGTSVASEV
jgi:hypothetical protein